jgi:hypothetical protein
VQLGNRLLGGLLKYLGLELDHDCRIERPGRLGDHLSMSERILAAGSASSSINRSALGTIDG